jgi:hypothetical protein
MSGRFGFEKKPKRLFNFYAIIKYKIRIMEKWEENLIYGANRSTTNRRIFKRERFVF